MLLSKKDLMAELISGYKSIKNHPFSDFTKNKIVFGVGNLDSKIVFLGEGPGADEDRLGEPFVGRAGQLLTKIISAMGYLREEVYITNVIKCRLENNRAPMPDEIAYDKSVMLMDELKVVRPSVICCLGASAMYAMLGYQHKISQARGCFFKNEELDCLIIPTYHPAYLLRNPSAKRFVWDDMQKIIQYLRSDDFEVVENTPVEAKKEFVKELY